MKEYEKYQAKFNNKKGGASTGAGGVGSDHKKSGINSNSTGRPGSRGSNNNTNTSTNKRISGGGNSNTQPGGRGKGASSASRGSRGGGSRGGSRHRGAQRVHEEEEKVYEYRTFSLLECTLDGTIPVSACVRLDSSIISNSE